MKVLPILALTIAFTSCAHPPRLATTLDVQKKSEGVVLVKLKIVNVEDRVTIPVAVLVTAQARTNGRWDKAATVLNPAAFVLNRKEQREITKVWRTEADAVRTTLVIKEQETGNLLKSEKAEKVLTAPTSP